MDSLYIKKVLKGDVDAYGYLVRQYQSMAMRTAIAIVKNKTDALDIVQDSFIQAFESLSKFRGNSKFSTWVCRIVINNSLKFIQKSKRVKSYKSTIVPNSEYDHNNGLLSLEKKDLENLLKKGLRLLAPKEALCIQLFYLEEYNIEEIVGLTELSKNNVKVLLHRGRKNLYQHLNQSFKTMKV